jgi:osmotically inducible protein OsmC
MATRIASAEWQGGVQDGKGTIASTSGAIDGQYSYSSRFEEGTGTNPEELIAAAHASCFSMALSFGLANAGHVVDSVRTEAEVELLKDGDGFAIEKITLRTVGRVPGIDAETFRAAAEDAKVGCPISKALAAVGTIELEATLEG